MKRSTVAALFAFGLLVPGSTAALADPSTPFVPAHRHFIMTANGNLVEVGPNVCDNPAMRDAFEQFHHNVHHSNGTTVGPQGGAKGLHDGQGAELVPRGCSFQP